MIEVSVGDEDQINGRQMMNFEAWSLQSFDHLEPLRPDRIDQYINFVGLDEERGMSNPCDANFAFADFRKLRRRVAARPFDEKRRNKNASEKIAFVPIGARSQPDSRGAFRSGTVAGHLTNDIASASFWKTNRHYRGSISARPSEAKAFSLVLLAVFELLLYANISEMILPESDPVVCVHLETPARLETALREGAHRICE